MGIGNSIQKEFSFFDKSIKEKNCQCYKLFAHYNPNSFSLGRFEFIYPSQSLRLSEFIEFIYQDLFYTQQVEYLDLYVNYQNLIYEK